MACPKLAYSDIKLETKMPQTPWGIFLVDFWTKICIINNIAMGEAIN